MLGDRIKTLRTARNLSQVELARKLNVSKQSVSNWENNNILPSVDIVKKLALFFPVLPIICWKWSRIASWWNLPI